MGRHQGGEAPFHRLVKGLEFKNLRIIILSLYKTTFGSPSSSISTQVYSPSLREPLEVRDYVLFISLYISFLLFSLDPNIMNGTY